MKKLKQNKQILFIALGSLMVIASYVWFSKTPYFQQLLIWSQQNIILFMSTLFVIKFIGIVFPPIPGGLITLGAVPFIGWKNAYLIDLAGSMAGSSIAFWIGKRYGYKILNKLFDEKSIQNFKKIKVKKDKEIESMFLLRIALGGTVAELLCYGAGLLKVTYINFLIGSTLSHIVIGVPTYYFANSLFDTKRIILNILILIILIPLLWKLRARYFE